MRRLSLAAAALFVCSLGTTARGDVFLLHNGGQVRGELLNKDQSPRTTYTVRTAAGGEVALEAKQVRSVQKQNEAQMEYDRLRWKYGDSVTEQWKLAEWCREHKLIKERRTHLEAIIAAEPDHERARHALGFSQVGGKWVTPNEQMKQNGLVPYKGKWITTQEMELLEQGRKNELAEKDWINKIKRWRSWLDGDKAAQARANIVGITDPYAARALSMGLKGEGVREIKLMYVESLANIGSPNALDVLVVTAIEDPDEEVRIICLDKILRAKYQAAVGTFVQKLKSPDNAVVNRAGSALGSMKDASAVGPLIDALVTVHKFKFVPPNPGQTSTTFGTGAGGGPGGFSFGQPKEQVIKQKMTNQAVLDSLVTLTGTNFNFDVQAWKYWYAAQKKPSTVNVRRD